MLGFRAMIGGGFPCLVADDLESTAISNANSSSEKCGLPLKEGFQARGSPRANLPMLAGGSRGDDHAVPEDLFQ
jgi:hypothetical protein